MKTTFKIKIIFASLFFIVFNHSCSDLDQEFYGNFEDEVLWNTKTDFDQAINGAVAYMDSPYGFYTRQFFLMEEATTDYFFGNAGSAGEYPSFDFWSSTFPTSFSWALWVPLHQSIYQSNLVLDRLDRFPIREDDPTTELNEKNEDEAFKAKIKGEALFFRSLNYYNLQNLFGGVPVVISTDDKRVAIPKSTREEVRQLIEADLKLAATLLPDVIEAKANVLPSRPSKQAAYGLLARMYLNWTPDPDGSGVLANRWQKVSDACDAVIDNRSNLGLESDYTNIFSLSNEKNKEIVYSIEHNTLSPPSGSFLLNNFNFSPADMKFPNGAQIGFGGDWLIKKTLNFSNSSDKRAKQILSSYTNKNGGTTTPSWFAGQGILGMPNKYPLDSKNLNNSFGGNDQPIIRYADIILMKAEALNNMNQTTAAIPYLNLIRNRAGLSSLPTSLLKGIVNNNIYIERRREFFFEGLGRTDMIRIKLSTTEFHDNEFLLWIQKKYFDDQEKIRYAKEYQANLNDPDNNPKPDPIKPFVEGSQKAENIRYLLFPFDGLALRNNPALIQNEGYR